MRKYRHCLRSVCLPEETPVTNSVAGKNKGAANSKRELLRRLLAEEAGRIPASSGQRRLWFVDRLGTRAGAYNVFQAVRLLGDLNIPALGNAINELIQRHEVLRTTFSVIDGEPIQVIHDAGSTLLEKTDLSGLSGTPQKDVLREITDEELTYPFDLGRGPMVRSRLLVLGATEHVLLFTLHHAIVDGWSLEVLFDELGLLYRAQCTGARSPLSPPSMQYGEFARWQRDWLCGTQVAAETAYWKQQLDGLVLLQMPTDRPRPAIQTLAGAELTRRIPAELVRGIRALGQRQGTTLFMTLLAGFVVLLRYYSGQDEIVVGSPVANRGRRELERVVGFFVNNLVLRTRLSEADRFNEVLMQVRKVCLEAFAHQQVPFERLVEEIQPDRDLSRNPLFQVAFALQREALEALQLDGVESSRLPVNVQTTHVDLECHMIESQHGLTARLVYSTDLFDESTMVRFLEHYERLLASVAASPECRLDELQLLGAAERRQLLVEWNSVARVEDSRGTVLDLFRSWALRHTDALAAECGDERLSYGELDGESNAIARYLVANGVRCGDRVGLCVERGLALVRGILAVWKAGAAYLPLDPEYPEARLRFMLQDAEASCVLTQGSLADRLRAAHATQKLLDIAAPAVAGCASDELSEKPGACDLAYMIYTSGSTGEPKGALLEHGGLGNVSSEQVRAFGVGPGDRVLQFSSPSFDAATFDVVMALGSGATLILADASQLQPGPPLARLLREKSVTVLTIPPSALGAVPAVELPALSLLNIAGEACSSQLVERWLTPDRRVFNLYGPTECTIWATMAQCVADGRPPPIGRPIGNVPCYVLDKKGQLLPVGVTGELYVGGAGVARGYWRREELSRQCFLPDPFAHDSKARIYRTGDRARWRSDGQLEFQGRIDKQVKVRGFRIETGEVEAVLKRHTDVREAVVISREDVPGEQHLVGYLVAENDAELSVSEVREYVRARLPGYMVPTSWLVLEALPLTPNGKVDLASLPALGGDRQVDEEYVAPRSELEAQIASIWSQVLKLNKVGIDDNFFDLGGHSLLATQVVSRVRSELSCDMALTDLFTSPTVRGIALRLETLDAGADREIGAIASIVPVSRAQELPLSQAQLRLWFVYQLEPENPAYNFPLAVRLIGEVSASGLQRSIQKLVERHEVLRTRFEQRDGLPYQIISPTMTFTLGTQDLSDARDMDREHLLMSRVRAEAARIFDLEQGPLIRGELLKAGDRDHVLVLTMHHIICDGWTRGLLFKELGAVYASIESGVPLRLPALSVQYADFAVWQQQQLSSAVLQKQLDYWRGKLADMPVLHLRSDRPRPPIRAFRGSEERISLPAELLDGLNALGRREEATLFMILLGALAVLLHRHGAGDDIAIGSPIAGRHHHQTENLFGFFINTLVMRVNLSGVSNFRALLANAKRTALEAFERQDVPFEKLVEELDPKRDLSRNPLFEVFLNVVNLETVELKLSGLDVSLMQTGLEAAKFDLTLYAVEAPGELTIRLNYNADLFDVKSIKRLLRHFLVVLQAVVHDPNAPIATLPLYDAAERDVLDSAARKARDGRAADAAHTDEGRLTLTGRFARRVAAAPECPAVTDGETTLTYRQLDRHSDAVAHQLLNSVGESAQRIALLLGHRAQTIVAELAVLKSGMAFVALDPLDPPERLSAVLRDARVSALLADAPHWQMALELADKSLPCLCLDNLDQAATTGRLPTRRPGSTAYLLYTSGSTGQPKAVVQTDRNVVHHATSYTRTAGIAAGEAVSLLSAYTFDAAIVDTFGALLGGATLCLYDLRKREIASLPEWLDRTGVSVYHSTPTVFRHMMQSLKTRDLLSKLRLVVLGGEPANWQDYALFRAYLPAHCQLLNLYGSTESSFSMYRIFGHDEQPNGPTLPIGEAVDETEVELVNEAGEPVDVFGEIAVRSEYITPGYWHAPTLNADKFLVNSDGARTYLTGDMGYRRTDGLIEYVGRLDQQIKLRGFRIELGEVESVLQEHAAVARALVVARSDGDTESAIVAYIVPSAGQVPNMEELRNLMRGRLPGYMIPQAILMIDKIPVTAGGKVKKSALPKPPVHPDRPLGYPAPRNETEKAIAEIWYAVLSLDVVGIHDDFFELGGHSLKATQVRSRIEDRFSVELPLRALFERRTVAEQADLVSGQVAHGSFADGHRIVASAGLDVADTDALSDEEVEAMLIGLNSLSEQEQ